MDTVNFTQICQIYLLGQLVAAPVKITSGLVNQVWQITTTQGQYVVKLVNIKSVRARSKSEYVNIEALAEYMKEHGISTVVAIKCQTGYVMELNDHHLVMVYPWVSARPICGATGPMPAMHAMRAGKILGQIHQLQLKQFTKNNFSYHYEIPQSQWQNYIANGELQNISWFKYLETELNMLLKYNQNYLVAQQRLQHQQIYSHGDYFPHNLLWNERRVYLIDWELAGLINPQTEFVLALVLFSGYATENSYDETALDNFFQGYFSLNNNLTDNFEDAFWGAIGKAWLNWLAFNMQQSLDHTLDSKTQEEFSQTVIKVYTSLQQMLVKKDGLITKINHLLANH